MATTIEDLLIGMRLDVDTQSFRNANTAFNGVKSAAVRMGASLGAGGVAAGITQLGTSYAATTAQLGRFAKESGVSAQLVSGLQFALEQSGGSAEDARASIGGILSLWRDFQLGDTSKLDTAARLGFDPADVIRAQDMQTAIEAIAAQTSKMGPQQRRNVLSALGLGEGVGVRTLFGQGSGDLQKYLDTARELAPVTDDMVDASIDATQALGEMGLAMKGFTDQMSLSVLPDLTEAMRELTGIMGYLRESSNDDDGAVGWAKTIWNSPDALIDRILKERDQINADGLGAWWDDVKAKGDARRNDDFGKGIYAPTASLDPIGDNILGALAMQESGGKHRGEDGRLTRSHAGALGMYQIKPSTGADPGYGIAPLKSNSEADQKAFADDYLTKMLKRYGNLDQALASYNAGAGAVDKAIKARGADWLSALPKETQNYVPSVKAKMSDQGGRPVSISGGLNVTVSGAHDPEAVGREVTRQIGVMASQAGDDYATGAV